jgi:hypothetical protein
MVLPYTSPERDLHFNVALALLVLDHLAETNRKKLLLNLDRLSLFIFLLKNPLIATRLLHLLGHQSFNVEDSESFSVRSLAPSWDELLNYGQVKTLVRYLGARKMLCAAYRKSDGVMLNLTELGKSSAQSLDGPFFQRATSRLQLLTKLNNIPTKTLYQHVYDLMRTK